MRRRYDRVVENFKRLAFTIMGIIMLAGMIMGPDRVDRFLADRKSGKDPAPLFTGLKKDTKNTAPAPSIITPQSDPTRPTTTGDGSLFGGKERPVGGAATGTPQAPQGSATATSPGTSSVAVPAAQPKDHVGSLPADRVTSGQVGRARTQTTGLKMVTAGSMIGYERDAFKHWSDPDDNDCDARADVLTRDAREIASTSKDGCKPILGKWIDPYGGSTVRESTKLDIDHVIALAAAWRLGAGEWSATQREAFANDPLNLLAVDASLNRSKGDKTVDTWKPPRRDFWCAYAVRTINVHAKYDLGVTEREKAALTQMLTTC